MMKTGRRRRTRERTGEREGRKRKERVGSVSWLVSWLVVEITTQSTTMRDSGCSLLLFVVGGGMAVGLGMVPLKLFCRADPDG
jgi:hypothetical protein